MQIQYSLLCSLHWKHSRLTGCFHIWLWCCPLCYPFLSLLGFSLPSLPHTHTPSVFSEPFMRCINYAPFASIPPPLSLFKWLKRLLCLIRNSYCILTTYQILTTIKKGLHNCMQIKHSNIKTHGLLWWMEMEILGKELLIMDLKIFGYQKKLFHVQISVGCLFCIFLF